MEMQSWKEIFAKEKWLYIKEMIVYKKERSVKVIIYTKTGELENTSKFLCPAKRKWNARE